MQKKIIFFLPNFSQGGAAQSIVKILIYLSNKKNKCELICLKKCFYKKTLLENGIKVLEIKSSRALYSMYRIRNYLLETSNHYKIYFVSNINYANILSIVFLKILFSYKVVITERTPFQELDYYYGFFDSIKKIIMKFLIPFLYKKSDLIICNSKKNSNELSKFINKKCNYIYPILPYIISKKNEFKKNSKIFNILSVGRYSKEKNFFDIIKSLSLIENKDIRLFLIGSGPDKLQLQRNLSKFTIKAKLINFSKTAEIKYFKKSHLFISSSDFEGYPNTVVQAINNNLPVLSTQSHGAINEILLYGSGGTFYKKRNVNDLSKKIIFIINNYKIMFKKTLLAKSKLKKFLPNRGIKKFDYLIKKIK